MSINNQKLLNQMLNEWRFEVIVENQKINISNKLNPFIKNNGVLKIPKNFNINKILQKPNKEKIFFYWKISNKFNKKWTPITILGGIPFNLDLNPIIKKQSLKIVYFINSDISSCYIKLMRDQLDDFIKSRIFISSKAKFFFVIICSNLERRKKIQKLIEIKKFQDYFDFEITFSNDNHKEYEGIKKIWELSNIKSNKSNLIMYCHAKGISYIQNKFFYIRQPLERFIFKLLIYNWERNLELLSRLNTIYKLGILSGGNGWLWFNFWIAKASYISKLEKPVKRNRACYYEDWLGRYLITKEKHNFEKYTNNYEEKFFNTINNTLSILSNKSKNKFNIGTPCKVEKGGFVGLGIVKFKYRFWYLFFVILNKLSINKGDKNRFKFF